jgi:hypothetical protein
MVMMNVEAAAVAVAAVAAVAAAAAAGTTLGQADVNFCVLLSEV